MTELYLNSGFEMDGSRRIKYHPEAFPPLQTRRRRVCTTANFPFPTPLHIPKGFSILPLKTLIY